MGQNWEENIVCVCVHVLYIVCSFQQQLTVILQKQNAISPYYELHLTLSVKDIKANKNNNKPCLQGAHHLAREIINNY